MSTSLCLRTWYKGSSFFSTWGRRRLMPFTSFYLATRGLSSSGSSLCYPCSAGHPQLPWHGGTCCYRHCHSHFQGHGLKGIRRKNSEDSLVLSIHTHPPPQCGVWCYRPISWRHYRDQCEDRTLLSHSNDRDAASLAISKKHFSSFQNDNSVHKKASISQHSPISIKSPAV